MNLIVAMNYINLGGTDLVVSKISLGGAAFSTIYGELDEAKNIALIHEALRRGITYFETGPWYGQGSSELTYGKALRGVPRDSFVIASKVGRYENDPRRMFDFSASRTELAIETTLQRLGMDYVDIMMVHDPTFADINVVLSETLPTLARAVARGQVRYIGVADYNVSLLRELVDRSPVPIACVLSYAKCTIFDNSLQHNIKFFKKRGVGVINAALTGMGLLTSDGPQPWHPASQKIRNLCRMAAHFCMTENVDIARLATWFSLQQPGVHTHVCGCHTQQQLLTALDVLEHGLTPFEHSVLREIQKRYFNEPTLNWDGVEKVEYEAALASLDPA